MNFKEWLLSEEIYSQNKTATVYHRTCPDCDMPKSVKSVSSILTSDYKVGKGCHYGCGLYTTFAIESQFTNYMKTYGKAVVKFKVTDLDKYLVFQLSEAKKIHGNDYKISDQLNKLGLLNKVDQSKLKYYDERQEKENYSSIFAYEFYEQNKWIVNSVKGIIYYGKNDGYCLLKYPTIQDGTITMLGYAVADNDDVEKIEELKNNKGWITTVGALGTSIKNVYNSKNKEKFAFGDNSKIIDYIIDQVSKSENLEEIGKQLKPKIEKISELDVAKLIASSEKKDKDKMTELIIKNKSEISDQNIRDFIKSATDIEKLTKMIIQNKKELSSKIILVLLQGATNKDKMVNLITDYKYEYKKEYSGVDVFNLIWYAKTKYIILQQFSNINISKLNDNQIRKLLLKTHDSDDVKAIAQIINKNHMNKTPEIQELLDNYIRDKYYQPQAIAAK